MSEPAIEDVLAYFNDVRADDNLELDEPQYEGDLSNTSRGEDPGTWVRAWVWCYDSDVQTWLNAKASREQRPWLPLLPAAGSLS